MKKVHLPPPPPRNPSPPFVTPGKHAGSKCLSQESGQGERKADPGFIWDGGKHLRKTNMAVAITFSLLPLPEFCCQPGIKQK